MTWLRDDVLVAYADDQLSGPTRCAVEHALAVDAEARRKVALFQETGCQVQRAFDIIDFSGVPAWFDRLVQGRGPGRRCRLAAARDAARARATRWPGRGLALAACVLLGIGIGILVFAVAPPGGVPERLLVLGDLPEASVLGAALDHIAERNADWTGPDQWRASGVASFRDRFGNDCREVEFFAGPAGDIPAQMVIACRGRASRWTILGAVTNQVAGAAISGSAIEAYYVPAEDNARSSLDSVLSMLGARDRTPATDRNQSSP